MVVTYKNKTKDFCKIVKMHCVILSLVYFAFGFLIFGLPAFSVFDELSMLWRVTAIIFAICSGILMAVSRLTGEIRYGVELALAAAEEADKWAKKHGESSDCDCKRALYVWNGKEVPDELSSLD